MNEHPLLFTTDMVKAVLDDRKTQTRRVPVERYRNWKVGDTIWVRETFRYCIFALGCGGHASGIEYKAGGIKFSIKARKYAKKARNKDKQGRHAKWRPSIHMPRRAARIFLKITGLRDERVQDISHEDVTAEGVIIRNIGETYWRAFHNFWDSINAKRHNGIYAWDKNPINKVIEFERISKDATNEEQTKTTN